MSGNQTLAEPEEFECETCQGEGEIDQRLGGEWNSGVTQCPDCNGYGVIYPKRKGVTGGLHD